MDRNIQIEIKDRIAHLVGNPKIICGNNDYSVTFAFDDEWAGVDIKTLRVSYNNKYSDHVFTGDTVELPPIIKAVEVYLGVFAGDITSTRVAVRAEPSILCSGGSVADPEPDVYNQLIELINSKEPSGGVAAESDPTVHEWAKEPQKPTYTAEEVGALSADKLGEAVDDALIRAKESGAFDGADGEPGRDGVDGTDGAPGADGKSAYQYAVDGGYEGSEEEFAAKLAQDIPAPYTLPVATADTLGGVKVGKGLVMDGEALGVEPEEEYKMIETIAVDKEVSSLSRSQELDGTRYNFKKIYIDIKTPQGSEKKVGIVSLNGGSVVPIVYLNNAIETHESGAWCKVFAHIDGNVLRGEGESSINGPSQLTWTNGNVYMRGFGEIGVTHIDRFQLVIVSGVIPVGTVIEIYGVRAK